MDARARCQRRASGAISTRSRVGSCPALCKTRKWGPMRASGNRAVVNAFGNRAASARIVSSAAVASRSRYEIAERQPCRDAMSWGVRDGGNGDCPRTRKYGSSHARRSYPQALAAASISAPVLSSTPTPSVVAAKTRGVPSTIRRRWKNSSSSAGASAARSSARASMNASTPRNECSWRKAVARNASSTGLPDFLLFVAVVSASRHHCNRISPSALSVAERTM